MCDQGTWSVLLVEDEQIIATQEASVLEKYGYSVTVVSSGEEALDRIVTGYPVDIVLMDIDLGPGIDGTLAARRILNTREIPVVFLTAHQEREMVDKVKGITRYGYVLKGSSEFVIIETIQMAFELFNSTKELRDYRKWLSAIIDSLPDDFFALDREGRYVLQNNKSRESGGNYVGKRIEDLPIPDKVKRAWRTLFEEAWRGETVSTQSRYTYDNVDHISDTTLTPVSVDGETRTVVGLTRDITEQHTLRRRLREHEAFYRDLFDTAPVGVFRTASTGEMLEANAQLARILGINDPDEVVNAYKDLANQLYADPNRRRELLRRLERDGVVHAFEIEARRHDGSLMWLSLDARKTEPDEHGLYQINGFATDITESKNRQVELQEHVRERELITREMQHRIKNDMHLVQSLLSLQAQQSETPQVRDSLHEAANRVSVMGRVYDALFKAEKSQAVDLQPLVSGLIDDLTGTILPSTVTVHADVEALTVRPSFSVVIGIIINELATNAAKYAFESTEDPELSIRVRSASRHGALGLEVSVRDSGPGVPEPVAVDRKFGYGMSMIDALAQRHDGEVRFEGATRNTVSVFLGSPPTDHE